MTKLASLKTWYSLEDAAKHLAHALGEPVAETDVLGLVADGHIPMYCRLQSSPARRVAKACLLEYVEDDAIEGLYHGEVTWIGDRAFRSTTDQNREVRSASYARIELLDCDEQPVVEYLDGVFRLEFSVDSAMRSWLHEIAAGNHNSFDCLHGLWVSDETGQIWSVLEYMPEQAIYNADNSLGLTEPFHRRTVRTPRHSDLVVPRSEIQALENRLSGHQPTEQTELGSRERQGLLNIIGGLLELLLGESPGGNRLSVFRSQAAVIDALLASHEGKTGIKKRTIEDKFAKAKRQISSD